MVRDGVRMAWRAGFSLAAIAVAFGLSADETYAIAHDPADPLGAHCHLPVNGLVPRKLPCNHPNLEGHNVVLAQCDCYGHDHRVELRGVKEAVINAKPDDKTRPNGDKVVYETNAA